MGQAAGTRGAQLEERYFRQKVKLGEGSFGTVWRAVDRQSGDTVAIKQLDKASMPRRGVTPQHVKQEIALMQACRHENILQLLDKFEDEAYIYLALEYCDGGDFGDKIREQGLGLSEREAADWVRQMCQAVCVLHTQGICHRDIKPDNFMVHKRTNLKLADFGLATVIPEKQLLPGACGTPAFNAPEQYSRSVSGGYSFPVDMWAVGVSMYMVMFGGKHPFMDDDQHLDKKALLQGKLDFRDRSSATGFLGFEGVGGMGLRFSEEARQLCRCLVEPDPHRRLPAQQAVCTPWLRSCSAPRRAATSVAPVHARSESKQQQAPQPSRAATPQQLRRGTSRRTSTPVQRMVSVPTPARHS